MGCGCGGNGKKNDNGYADAKKGIKTPNQPKTLTDWNFDKFAYKPGPKKP